MKDKGKRWHYTARTGKPIECGNFTIIPQSKAFSIINSNFEVIWNHPTSILVKSNNKTQRIPIIDYTRFVQFVLYGVSIILFMMTILRMISHGRRKNV